MNYKMRFKDVREDKDMTQKEASKLIGITQQQLSIYENNLQYMSIDRLLKFCEVYDVSPNYLLGWSKDEKKHHKNDVLNEN